MKDIQLIQKFIFEVKKNKKYSTISNEIVINEIKSYLNKNPKMKEINKQSVKEIRSKLHRLYSSYLRGKKNKRLKLLEDLKKNPSDINLINKILSTSISTKERINDYENLYKEIFKITGVPNAIVDLGCGINPISFIYMHINNLNYFAYDIDEEDINFLNNYFKISRSTGLIGEANLIDINNLETLKKIPSSDIIFLFKLIDLINKKNKNLENILLDLIKKTKFIIASFSTKTLSGKSMNLPARYGFELMLERIGLKFVTLKIKNEIFYIIKS